MVLGEDMKRFISCNRRGRRKIRYAAAVLISVSVMIWIFSMFSGNMKSADGGADGLSPVSAIASGLMTNVIRNASHIVGYQLDKDNSAYDNPSVMVSRISYIHRNLSTDGDIPENDYLAVWNDSVLSEQKQLRENKEKAGKTKGGLGFMDYTDFIPMEYILTNGAMLKTGSVKEYMEAKQNGSDRLQELPVSILDGDIYYNSFENDYGGDEATEVMRSYDGTPFTLNQLNDVGFLIKHFYIVDPATRITEDLFNAKALLSRDMTLKATNDKPQILIYHTHSQEAYLDSRKNEPEDSMVGVGSYLAGILRDKYGYNVIHDTSVYDLVDGKLDRNKAYTYARENIEKILEENPSIEVIIDLHRDGAEKRSTVINGEETAQIMLLNGLSRNQSGPITRLYNPNLQDNLAFSLQLHLKSLEMYPGLFYKNYLQDYRYNLDLRPKSLLIELGTHKNTLRSAKKAMEPFAEILDAVLKGQ